MSGAGFILAINIFVAGALALAFLVVAVFDRARTAARWFSLTYASGIAYLTLEFFVAAVPSGGLAQVLIFASFLVSLVLFNIGLARKYSVPIPWRAMAAVIAASLAVSYAVWVMPRGSILRLMLYQTPYFAMQVIGAGIVLSAVQRRMLDNLLAGLLMASALQFLSKPFLAVLLGGNGATALDYHTTFYALVSQTMGTVFALSVALVTLMVMVSDVLTEATERSETDALSGLLNRRGFERRAGTVLQEVRRKGRAFSLVLCDLDHFKSINDTHGHSAGDRTIAAFGRFIAESGPPGHLSGRIGGEEFAVALPGAHLLAARLFAEGARSAFSALAIPGFPDDAHCTASFGVAEIEDGETIEELMRRADAALYEAKRNGRNQVRAAAPRLVPSTIVSARPA